MAPHQQLSVSVTSLTYIWLEAKTSWSQVYRAREVKTWLKFLTAQICRFTFSSEWLHFGTGLKPSQPGSRALIDWSAQSVNRLKRECEAKNLLFSKWEGLKVWRVFFVYLPEREVLKLYNVTKSLVDWTLPAVQCCLWAQNGSVGLVRLSLC